MKSSQKKLLGIILSICLIIAIFAGTKFMSNNDNTSDQSWAEMISVEDGKVSPQSSNVTFHVNEDGNYNIAYSWVPDGTDVNDIDKMDPSKTSFLTVIKITDKDGVTKFSTTAGAIYLNTTNFLEAGDYNVAYYYFADREEFIEYAKKYFCSEEEASELADTYDFANNIKDCTCKMNYNLNVKSVDADGSFVFFIMFIAISVIIIFTFMALKASQKSTSLPEFDERQQIIRGKGFKYGFFAILISEGIALFVDSTNALPMIDSSVLYVVSIFVGLFIFAVYCAWNEAYFALNQNSRFMIIYLSFIGILNAVIFVLNVIRGNVIENGKITMSFLNLICALFFLALFTVCAVKKAINAKEDTSEE